MRRNRDDGSRVPYPSDLTGEQRELLERLLVRAGKPGPKHGRDLRRVVDGMLSIAKTGCQWRYLPAEFGPYQMPFGDQDLAGSAALD
jgi:transposase